MTIRNTTTISPLEQFVTTLMEPGGIERQEAVGQMQLAASSQLPAEGLKSCQLPDGLIVHGEAPPESDPLFYPVTLPAGWRIVPTDHAMWSDLVDVNGAKRAGIFYKAAFYDRKAHMHWNTRYYVDAYRAKSPMTQAAVLDRVGDVVLFETPAVERGGGYAVQDKQEVQAKKWLDVAFPNHANPYAYWPAEPPK